MATHGCSDETESTEGPTPTPTTTTTSSQGGGGAGGQPGGSGGDGATAGSGGVGASGGSGGCGDELGGSGGSGGSAGSGGSSTIDATVAEVRDMADGTLTDPVTIRGAYVTYTRDIGFYVQDVATGPGLFVYTHPQIPSSLGISVGNPIDLEVTTLGTYHGMKQVVDFTVTASDNGSYDVVGSLARDISAGAGTAPSEDTESALLLAVNMDLLGGTATTFQAEIGTTPVGLEYYHYMGLGLGLCVGARLDTIGIADDYDGSYSLRAWQGSDVPHLDRGSCAPSNSDNGDLEDWASSDPPAGFFKTTIAELGS